MVHKANCLSITISRVKESSGLHTSGQREVVVRAGGWWSQGEDANRRHKTGSVYLQGMLVGELPPRGIGEMQEDEEKLFLNLCQKLTWSVCVVCVFLGNLVEEPKKRMGRVFLLPGLVCCVYLSESKQDCEGEVWENFIMNAFLKTAKEWRQLWTWAIRNESFVLLISRPAMAPRVFL